MIYFLFILLFIWGVLLLILHYVIKGLKINKKVSKDLKELEQLKLEGKINEDLYKKQRVNLSNNFESPSMITLGFICLFVYLLPVVYVTISFIFYLID